MRVQLIVRLLHDGVIYREMICHQITERSILAAPDKPAENCALKFGILVDFH